MDVMFCLGYRISSVAQTKKFFQKLPGNSQNAEKTPECPDLGRFGAVSYGGATRNRTGLHVDACYKKRLK
jgi:hypothetical protein